MSDELAAPGIGPEPASDPDLPGDDHAQLRHRSMRPVDAGLQEPVDLPIEFEAFYLNNHARYRHYAAEVLGDDLVAREVAHEAFLCIGHSWDQLLTEPDFDDATWQILAGAVMYELNTNERLMIHFRARLSTGRATLTRMKAWLKRMTTHLDSGIGLYEALADLPDRQFDVLVLRRFNKYSSEFTAMVLDIHTRTVDYHLRKAVETLDHGLQKRGLLHPTTDTTQPEEGGDR